MKVLKYLLITLISSGMILVSTGALSQDVMGPRLSPSDPRWESLYSAPGKFTINDTADIEVVDFETSRDVMICLGISEHIVPLEVRYRGKVKTIKSGNCMTVEAKEISLSAADTLSEGWNLVGTYVVIS